MSAHTLTHQYQTRHSKSLKQRKYVVVCSSFSNFSNKHNWYVTTAHWSIQIVFYQNKTSPTQFSGDKTTCVTVSLARPIMSHSEIDASQSMKFVSFFSLEIGSSCQICIQFWWIKLNERIIKISFRVLKEHRSALKFKIV